MITKNPMQLKAFIKKKAAEKKISAQLVMQNYGNTAQKKVPDTAKCDIINLWINR